MPAKYGRPPFDPELEVALAKMQLPQSLTPDLIVPIRTAFTPTWDDVPKKDGVECEDRVIPGPGGDLKISIIRPTGLKPPPSGSPCIFFAHGGGMVSGSRFTAIELALDFIREIDGICVTAEYRLSPEHPDPAPIEDCYAALLWTRDHASELEIDLAKLMLAGNSAGGGLAAGLALMSRDRKGPALCAMMLIYPMLDDTNTTISSHQCTDGIWNRESNDTGWDALLGDRRKGKDVSLYAAPSRATDLAGLPQAYVDVGSAEVFRDEDVAFAMLLCACGVQTELHVWPGAFHGSDFFVPDAALSLVERDARLVWLRRIFPKSAKSS